ncbi:hypothetical protein CsSME_00037190 [Camellia sinensis var. sinensis]
MQHSLDLDPGLGLGPDHGQDQGAGPGLNQGPGNDVGNPGNTLYVTGLSTRVTEREVEDHFSKEGKVASCFLVVKPRTRASRGFAFFTMDIVNDANRCIKRLMLLVADGCCLRVAATRCWSAANL